MKCIVSRVKESKLYIDNELYSEINQGLLIYLGIKVGDNLDLIEKMVNKLIKLRIFDDENGKLNKSVIDVKGKIMFVSNFTVYGNALSGNRPDYINAEKSETAKPLYYYMLDRLNQNVPTVGGVFGADMQINSINDGPVNLIIEY
jgi:D-tyrosyl-tRNA(Tyr) deacylase